MNRTDAPADCWLLCIVLSILHPISPLMRVLGWQCSSRVFLQTSASFYSTHSIDQCLIPPTTNPTPQLVKKELHIGLDLESMLVMLSPTNLLMMTPRKSSTDLLLDLQILPIPTRDWYQMEGRAPRPQPHCLCQV